MLNPPIQVHSWVSGGSEDKAMASTHTANRDIIIKLHTTGELHALLYGARALLQIYSPFNGVGSQSHLSLLATLPHLMQ